MARIDHELIDFIEQFRRKHADVVCQRLMMVIHFVEHAVAEHGTDITVFIGQVVQSVVINTQIQPDYAEHQNRP